MPSTQAGMEPPELTSLHGEWQKDGIFIRTVSGIGEAAGELTRDTDYLLVIIFQTGRSIYLH